MATGAIDKLPVANLVRPADPDAPAQQIADRVWMSPDISNSFLIATDTGAIVINAGTPPGGKVHRARYEAIGPLNVKYLVLTQSHPDHYGGIPSLRGPDTVVVAEQRFPDNYFYRENMRPYYGPNSARIWRAVIGSGSLQKPDFSVRIDHFIDRRDRIELGGRTVELIATPGGETTDALVVWLPQERMVLTGNLFGPAFMTVPNVNTIRTDKPRSVLEYVRSANIVLSLRPEKLVTGHGEIVEGWEKIEADVTHLRDAVQYIHDATIEGMNARKSVHELMETIRLPDHLALGEAYGKVDWTVRTVYEEYTGWFHQDYTSSLYAVPREAVMDDTVTLAGADRLAEKAAAYLAEDKSLHALHLVEMVLTAEPDHKPALKIKIAALDALLETAAAANNLNEIMWLRSERQVAEEQLST